MRHPESVLQRRCVGWFRRTYPPMAKLLFAVPNGGLRSKVEAAIMREEGLQSGVSDLILLVARGGYGALCIEVKTTAKSSTLSADQRAWHEVAKEYGNAVVVVRTFEQFVAVIEWYLALPPHSLPYNTYEEFDIEKEKLELIVGKRKKKTNENYEEKLLKKLLEL